MGPFLVAKGLARVRNFTKPDSCTMIIHRWKNIGPASVGPSAFYRCPGVYQD